MAKASHLLSQLVFLVWTAFLTYRNGPYYTMLELCRNFQIFGVSLCVRRYVPSTNPLFLPLGYRKLEYDKEFTAPLNGKVCVITGGTRGIGLEVVRFLFAKGCIVLTGTSTLPSDSSPENIAKYKHNLLLQVLKTEVIDQTTKDLVANRLVVLPLDLTSMASVVKFANEISQVTSKIDYMVSKQGYRAVIETSFQICNGGAMFVPFRLTRDNFECHMSINYLSHCLLIVKLLPLLSSPSALSARAKSRIVVVSSGAHHASLGLRLHDLHSTSLYSVYHGYAQSKLALVMFTYRFHRWLQSRPDLSSQVTINCLHPGVCRTGLMERFNFFKLKFIQETPFFRVSGE